ncbi:helix-turn-helix domain-containing protein [Thalassotalea sp. 1_MG-2023]|uniref:helix-turn-helix domain-containing protein n=1 Tax=Thalassotalea sp. 1_MG-2023 TaxID=3062680 RepID=UPI0026E17370|nr:helix-turn-helix domain-containing protein [Thalassotalea sp. 1_MG-2023]MDO6426989.1 helix-turn-helix domain-containing protein [Thalassotalea sp. 1_MG-2023]
MLININDYSLQGRVNNSDSYLTLKPASSLSNWVQEYWQLNVPNGKYFYRSVPDNCVDLIINLSFPEEVFIVSPFSSAKVFEMIGPVSYFGIRFRILGHQGIIQIPLGEWSNDDNVISDILPENFLSALCNSSYQVMSFQKRCEFLSKILLDDINYFEIDRRLMRYILHCDRNITSNIDISNKQCSEFGVSARHLRRLTSQYLGLSPREFAKVFRFQKTLRAMNAANCPNVWASYYYDQPHFHRDFKNMSGVTPNQFRTMSALYNTD